MWENRISSLKQGTICEIRIENGTKIIPGALAINWKPFSTPFPADVYAEILTIYLQQKRVSLKLDCQTLPVKFFQSAMPVLLTSSKVTSYPVITPLSLIGSAQLNVTSSDCGWYVPLM